MQEVCIKGVGDLCIWRGEWSDPCQILLHTVKEWVVHILLEYIFVLNYEGSFLSGFMDFQLGTFTPDLGFVT